MNKENTTQESFSDEQPKRDESLNPPASRLSDTQRILIEQRIANDKLSVVVTYLFCVFFGVFGAHRFYLGRKGSAIAMLLLTLTLVGTLISWPWAIIDLFLIPSILREKIDAMRMKMTMEAL